MAHHELRNTLQHWLSGIRQPGCWSLPLCHAMAFQGLTKLPENFRFIANGYSAYSLAALEFAHRFGENFAFKITQVIGLTIDDAVSTEYWPFKQVL